MRVTGKQGCPRETADEGCANPRRMLRAAAPPTLQVVVVGVLRHAAVQEGPGEVVHSILLVLDGLGDDLGIEVVVHTVVQVRLHRQRLIQELLEEILWARMLMTVQSQRKAKGKQGRWATGTAHEKRKKAAAQTRRAGSGPAELGVYACSPGITGYFYHGGRYTEPHGLSRA